MIANANENSNSQILQESEEEENIGENHENYKGIYYDENANEQEYYEGGAHFSYANLCSKLEKLICVLSPDRKGKSIYEDEYSTHGSSVVKTKTDSGKILVENHKVLVV